MQRPKIQSGRAFPQTLAGTIVYWRDSTPAMFYGLPKIHKVNLLSKEDHLILEENTTSVPMRPINSCIGSPTYSVSKYLANQLRSLKQENSKTVKNSKQFTDFVSTQVIEDDEIIVSFDVVSLYLRPFTSHWPCRL